MLGKGGLKESIGVTVNSNTEGSEINIIQFLIIYYFSRVMFALLSILPRVAKTD